MNQSMCKNRNLLQQKCKMKNKFPIGEELIKQTTHHSLTNTKPTEIFHVFSNYWNRWEQCGRLML